MRRLFVAFIGLATAAAVAAPSALADPPIITPAPLMDFVDTTCGFPIAVHFTVNRETAKTFTNGTTIITGPLFAQLTANGKTVSLNISGPVRITPTGAVLAHGVGLGPLSTANGVILAYAAGAVDAANGVLEHGTILLNLCDALAP